MCTRRLIGLLAACLGFLALPASVLFAEKPIPNGKDAYTCAQLKKEMHEYLAYQSSFYEKCTRDPPDIRDAAKKFLTEVLKREAGDREGLSWEELGKRGALLHAQEETDPHILAEMAYVLRQAGRPAEAIPLLEQAVEDFSNSDYPASRKCRAYDLLHMALDETNAPAERWESFKGKCRKQVLLSMGETLDEPKFRRPVWLQVLACYRPKTGNGSRAMLPATIIQDLEKAKKVDPWMKNMISGTYYNAMAWQARGSGFANTVTEEGWKGFRENIAKSAECFTKVWEIDPKLPYGAVAMIGNSMSGGDEKHSPRDWFDRAVEAQMDCPEAYDKYLWSIRPRWHGNHEMMYQFGLECLETKRFDTEVPELLIRVLLDIDSEIGSNGEIWKEEGVFDNIKKLVEGLEKEPSRRNNSDPALNTLESTLSVCFLIALEVREYDEARKFLDKIGGKIELEAFPRFKKAYPYDVSRVYALTGAAGEKAKDFDDLVADNGCTDPDVRKSAQEILEEASKKDPDSKAKFYFDYWKNAIGALDRFEKGEWIDLAFDEQLTAWEAVRGDWKTVGEHAARGVSKKGNGELGLKCRIPFKAPYEIECDAEFPEPAEHGSAGLMLGCLWAIEPDDIIAVLGVDTAQKDLLLSLPNEQPKREHIEIKDPKKYHVKLRYWNPQFEFSAEGQTLSVKSLPKAIVRECFVLASTSNEVQFSNVRIRKLGEEPPADKEAEKP